MVVPQLANWRIWSIVVTLYDPMCTMANVQFAVNSNTIEKVTSYSVPLAEYLMHNLHGFVSESQHVQTMLHTLCRTCQLKFRKKACSNTPITLCWHMYTLQAANLCIPVSAFPPGLSACEVPCVLCFRRFSPHYPIPQMHDDC